MVENWLFLYLKNKNRKKKLDLTASVDFSAGFFQKIPATSPLFSWAKKKKIPWLTWLNRNKNWTTAPWDWSEQGSRYEKTAKAMFLCWLQLEFLPWLKTKWFAKVLGGANEQTWSSTIKRDFFPRPDGWINQQLASCGCKRLTFQHWAKLSPNAS